MKQIQIHFNSKTSSSSFGVINMSDQQEEKTSKSKMEDYDFFQLVVYDIHSTPKGRLLTKDKFLSILHKGIGVLNSLYFMGIQQELNDNDHFSSGNAYLVPILDTLVDVSDFPRGDNRVGQVLCEFRLLNGTMEPTTPRYVAQRQIERLASLGFTIRSGFEIEFTVLDGQGDPWGHTGQKGDLNVITEKQDILLGMCKELSNCGVPIETLELECSPGMYEANLKIGEGLEGPDLTSRFKAMSKVYFKKFDLSAIFMSKPFQESIGTSCQFNMSLWTGDGQDNVFLDVDKPHCFSTTGRQWLAGLIKHTPGLTALCCPTVNCYRQINKKWAPCKSNWGYQDRMACYRLVTESDNNIYLECRLPANASNPYIVMAAIIAAGVDGIENELSLDDVNQETELPVDLETALRYLNEDKVLVQSLGKEFVDCFTHVKKTYEIDHFKALGKMTDLEKFKAETDIYLYRC